MKSVKVFMLALACAMLCGIQAKAQSWKDLFNKDNLEKLVDTVTGNTTPINLTGTWTYTGSAIEFESDNFLQQAGGAAAAAIAENKLDEQLEKIGISKGKLSYTFNSDSTFVSTIGQRTLQGTYSYNAESKEIQLKYLYLLNVTAKVDCTSQSMKLLFKADKLLDMLVKVASLSQNNTLQGIASLAETYEGMRMGYALEKQ